MAILKIKNEQGGWDDIPALRGRDGAIQYTAGANIEISSENVISAIGLEGTVTRDDVEEMIGEAVPTKTSDLDNDSGFITDTDVPSKTSDLTNDSGFITSDAVPTKTSDLTNDVGFITVAQVPAEQEPAFNGSVARNITQTDINNWNGKQAPIVFNSTYNATTNKAATMNDMPFVPTKLSDLTNDSGYALRSELPTVPTKLSDLTNDTGFITSSSIPTKTSDLTNDSNFATLSDIPSVPTKTSELTNDAGFVTNSSLPTKLSDLTNDTGYITSADIPTDNVALGTGPGSRIISYNATDNKPNQDIISSGEASIAEGYNSIAVGDGAHAEGYNGSAKIPASGMSIAGNTITFTLVSSYSLTVGSVILDITKNIRLTVTSITKLDTATWRVVCTKPAGSEQISASDKFVRVNALGSAAHCEGLDCQAIAMGAHAEGGLTKALGTYSHAEGTSTKAIGNYSHAGGYYCTANANYSYAQGVEVYNDVEKAMLLGKYGELDSTTDANVIFAVANGSDDENLNIGMKLVGTNGNGKLYVENTLMGADPSTYSGYDASKTQVLKNVNGVFTWVDE